MDFFMSRGEMRGNRIKGQAVAYHRYVASTLETSMTNLQLYLAIGLPTLSSFLTLILVLIAWLSNRSDNAASRAEMIALRRDMAAEFMAFRRDIAAEFKAFRRGIC